MPAPPKVLCGVVVSAGKMMKAVKVRTAKQVYNKFLQKQFMHHENYLVSDPNSSLRLGDVVKIYNERKVSRHIKHVVTEILAPWGPAITERPPIMTADDRERVRREKKGRKRGKQGGDVRIEGRKEARKEGSREGRDTESEEDHVEGVVEGTMVAS